MPFLKSDDPSDEMLLRLLTAGDEEAFTALYRRRQGGIYRFALQMTGSEATAEEVTQEVFLALLVEGGRFVASRGSLQAYLYGVARHHLFRRLRRDRMLVPLLDDSSDTDAREHERTAPENTWLDLTRSETVEIVRKAVLSLPPHYRAVVALCDLQELDYADAAEALGCAVGTVRSRLHRARGMLVEKLKNQQSPAAAAKGCAT